MRGSAPAGAAAPPASRARAVGRGLLSVLLAAILATLPGAGALVLVSLVEIGRLFPTEPLAVAIWSFLFTVMPAWGLAVALACLPGLALLARAGLGGVGAHAVLGGLTGALLAVLLLWLFEAAAGPTVLALTVGVLSGAAAMVALRAAGRRGRRAAPPGGGPVDGAPAGR